MMYCVIVIQKLAEEDVDCYAEVVDMVTRIAPPISIPWLSSGPGPAQSPFCELNVKKTVAGPKTKEKQ